jgi:hypothetical protein
MTRTRPKYGKEEFAQRGDEIYERDIKPALGDSQAGQFVAIDIETSAFEVDPDDMTASDRLRARVPNAQIWLTRAGSPYARRFRARATSSAAPRATGRGFAG